MKVKYSTIIILSVTTLMFTVNGFCSTVFYAQSKTPGHSEPVKLEADVNNLIFTGVIKRIPNGTALITNSATYLLDGGNFEAMAGKEVNILGRVVKEGSIEKIIVSRAQLAEKKQ